MVRDVFRGDYPCTHRQTETAWRHTSQYCALWGAEGRVWPPPPELTHPIDHRSHDFVHLIPLMPKTWWKTGKPSFLSVLRFLGCNSSFCSLFSPFFLCLYSLLFFLCVFFQKASLPLTWLKLIPPDPHFHGTWPSGQVSLSLTACGCRDWMGTSRPALGLKCSLTNSSVLVWN